MSDMNETAPMAEFDETNGIAGNLQGESDGTAAGENESAAFRDGTVGPAVDDQDAYVAETVQQQQGSDESWDESSAFHTGD